MIKLSNFTVLVLIIVVAAALRFFNYADIPFTHDEFSALSRLHYDNFSTLIREGVMPDGHPAGIQVFLYYWVRLFGEDEWIVKLPFTVFGLLSVWLVYKVASKWFNETAGLLSAAFFASIQYTVMYSQIARPYISGLFFSLLMVYYWSNIVQTPGKRFNRNSLLFIISASLCSYNHHFSLLFAFLVGISGLFIVDRKYLIKYLVSALVIFVLYIPHLKIFFHQLSLGGIGGWLATPRNDFFVNYLSYIFNFSFLSLATILLVILFGIVERKSQAFNFKHYLLFFSWFLIPMLTGFFYSRYVNAVLQFSVLIFSFTYLLFLLFGHMRLQKPLVNLLLVSAIMVANIFSLVHTREHYKLFYQNPNKAILEDFQEVRSTYTRTIFIVNSHPRNTLYYSERLGIDTSGLKWFESFKDEQELKCFLESHAKMHTKLYLGALSSINPLAVPLIREYYPKIEWRRDYLGATTYLFSQRHMQEQEHMIGKLDFESNAPEQWNSLDPGKYTDSIRFSGNCAYHMDSATKYGPTFSDELDEIAPEENDFIEISVKVRGPLKGDLLLVASLDSDGENIYWGNTPFDSFVPCGDSLDQWVSVHHVLKLSDIYLKYPNLQFKAYIWNKGGASFFADDLQIKLRTGNPVIYGLNENFKLK